MNRKIVFLLLLLFGLFFITGLNVMGEHVVSYNTMENFKVHANINGNKAKQIASNASTTFNKNNEVSVSLK